MLSKKLKIYDISVPQCKYLHSLTEEKPLTTFVPKKSENYGQQVLLLDDAQFVCLCQGLFADLLDLLQGRIGGGIAQVQIGLPTSKLGVFISIEKKIFDSKGYDRIKFLFYSWFKKGLDGYFTQGGVYSSM